MSEDFSDSEEEIVKKRGRPAKKNSLSEQADDDNPSPKKKTTLNAKKKSPAKKTKVKKSKTNKKKNEPSEDAEEEENDEAMGSDDDDQKLSSYEAERLRKIQQNQEFLQKLGLATAVTEMKEQIEDDLADADSTKKSDKKKRKDDPYEFLEDKPDKDESIPSEPTRRSARLKGEKPLSPEELLAMKKALKEENKKQRSLESIEDVERGSYSGSLWRGRKCHYKLTKSKLTTQNIHLPVTLGSIATTIYSAGRIYTGPHEAKYWSNAGCLHHHRYPIGWKASKEYFGRIYFMEIRAGPKGPLFVVIDAFSEDKKEYKGPTPTKPWTEVCLDRSKGTRVSGPLFFGFSDPISQYLIKQLENKESTVVEDKMALDMWPFNKPQKEKEDVNKKV